MFESGTGYWEHCVGLRGSMMATGLANQPQRRATLQDVAALAAVSTATASHALVGKGKMSELTRTRVREAAEKLNYRPNHQAAALRRRTTNTIGFVMVPDRDPYSPRRWGGYSAEQLYSVVSEAAKRGYSVTVIPEDQSSLVETSRIDALFFLDIANDEPSLLEAFRLGIPVLTNDVLDERFDVVIDTGYASFTRHALDLLSRAGAMAIGLLTERRGIKSDEVAEDVYLSWCAERHRVPIVVRGNYGRTDTIERVNELLDAGCDAIYSFYEEGPAIVAAIHDRGRTVPGDVRLIAAVTPASLSAASAGITSIVFHPELVATYSFDALINAVADRTGEAVRVELPWEVLDGISAGI